MGKASFVSTKTVIHPQLLSDSTMWQSARWTQFVDSVHERAPRHRLFNHPLVIALKLLLRRRQYRVVLTTGNKTALFYGLLCRALGMRQKQVVTQLYLDDHGHLGWLHDSLMRFVLRGAYGVLVPSRGEIPLVEQRFGVSRDLIRFVPYHTTVTTPEEREATGGYVLAAGRNFRDYETLIRALDGLDVQTVIVCGEDQLRGVRIPENVTVRREIPWERYLELLREASVAVVPLTTEIVPSGQVAILEATAYGKPVITTRAIGTVDYIEDGIDGLLYTAGDADELRAKILKLTTDHEYRCRMAAAAYRSTVEKFTFDVHVDAKLKAISELVSASAATAELRNPSKPPPLE